MAVETAVRVAVMVVRVAVVAAEAVLVGAVMAEAVLVGAVMADESRSSILF